MFLDTMLIHYHIIPKLFKFDNFFEAVGCFVIFTPVTRYFKVFVISIKSLKSVYKSFAVERSKEPVSKESNIPKIIQQIDFPKCLKKKSLFSIQEQLGRNITMQLWCTLYEKCPNTEFFWSVFSRIWTEYGDLLRKSPYSVRIRENTDQKKLRSWTFFSQWQHYFLGFILYLFGPFC